MLHIQQQLQPHVRARRRCFLRQQQPQQQQQSAQAAAAAQLRSHLALSCGQRGQLTTTANKTQSRRVHSVVVFLRTFRGVRLGAKNEREGERERAPLREHTGTSCTWGRARECLCACVFLCVCVFQIEQQLTAASRRLAASVLLRARCLQHRNFASPSVFGSRSLFRLRFLPFMLSVSVSPFNLSCCCCCCCRARCVCGKNATKLFVVH